MKNFVLIGAAGYVAPRHMKAIKETGNNLLAALDPNDSVGILDSYFPDADFFTEFERFDRHCEKLKRNGTRIDYVSICSPNYLHDAHIRFALRIGAHAICEKPMVLNPWNVDALAEIENEYPGNIYNILQLRLHPSVVALKKMVEEGDPDKVYDIDLQYITSRGKWYHVSWKGNKSKSGGIATNIGIHFFDMLIWIFGEVITSEVVEHSKTKAYGKIKLQRAKVNWRLSVDAQDLPRLDEGHKTYRSLKIDDQEFEFSGGFEELHTRSYMEVLEGRGYGIGEVVNSIEVASSIRSIK